MEDKYVVAMVTKLREKGIPELEEIKDGLEPLIIKELKGDFMVKKMNDIAASSSSMEQIAQKLNSKVDTLDNITFNTRSLGSYGNEANVTSKVFSLQPNVMSKAIKGNNAAFIVIIDNLTKPAETDDKNVFAKQLTGNFKSKVNNSSFAKTLEEKAGVTDNRYLFY
jgi:peptidyl-prolyl cis-trans isomerase D